MKLGHSIIFILSLFSSTLTYSQNAICKFDTSRFAELLQTQFPYKTYDTISFVQRSQLTEPEKCIIQRLLADMFIKNQDSLPYGYSDYKIQLVSAIDGNGRKFVWINGICNLYIQHRSINWRRSIVRTADGGYCFFHGLINLNRETIMLIIFNGEAKIKKPNSEQNVQVSDTTEAK